MAGARNAYPYTLRQPASRSHSEDFGIPLEDVWELLLCGHAPGRLGSERKAEGRKLGDVDVSYRYILECCNCTAPHVGQ